MVLISDGEATVSLINGNDPTEEALFLARNMCKEKIPSLVISTLARHQRLMFMPRLAQSLGTVCHYINELHAGKVLQLIKKSRQAPLL
jgi:Mg-chelatase subunit ChlD